MIRVFSEIMLQGTEMQRAGRRDLRGAYHTAAGLSVAIPSFVFRYFMRKVDSLILNLEQESSKLVDALHSDRQVEIK